MLRQTLTQAEILALIMKAREGGARNAEATKADKVASGIIYILSREDIFKPYFQELNDKLQSVMPAKYLSSKPKEYQEIMRYRIPAPHDEALQHGNRLTLALEKILLEQEQKHGVNLRRTTKDIPLLVGLVDDKYAGGLITGGDLWNDDLPLNKLWVHGRYSHRLQHYIVTRYLEDHPEFFKDLLEGESSDALFRFLVPPLSDATLFGDNSHWLISLDNNRGGNLIIESEPNLTGPGDVNEYTMTEDFFSAYPYLANAQYHSHCQPVFAAAKELKMSVRDVFTTCCAVIKEYYNSHHAKIDDYNKAQLSRFANHVDFTNTLSPEERNIFKAVGSIPDTRGVMYLTPCTPKFTPGFFANNRKNDGIIIEAFYKKYGVNKTDNTSSDIETILRRAAFNGNAKDVELLVERFSVNVNAQDISKKRTAMHYVLAKAKIASKEAPAKVESYRRCAEFLAKHGYDFTLIDGQGKTALHYDSFGWMAPYVKTNSTRGLSLSSTTRVTFEFLL